MRTLFRSVSPALLLALSLAACAEPASPEVANEPFGLEGRSATIEFTADYQTRVTGSLEAGGIANVRYDAARLTTCRGSRIVNEAAPRASLRHIRQRMHELADPSAELIKTSDHNP